jgi:hypothetical protein
VLNINGTATFRAPDAEQLFVAYGSRGSTVSKQCISAWLIKLIQFVYNKGHLPVPFGVKDHQTCKQATSIADLAGVDPHTICEVANWASLCTFAHHYHLDFVAQVRSRFGRMVLQVAGSGGPLNGYSTDLSLVAEGGSGHVLSALRSPASGQCRWDLSVVDLDVHIFIYVLFNEWGRGGRIDGSLWLSTP